MKSPVRFVPPSAFELLMMVLSIVSLAAVVLHQFGPFNAAEKELLLYLDTGICVILLSHFFYGLARAPSKKRFLRVHWIDFIASIPAIDVLRYGRIRDLTLGLEGVLRMLRVANQVIRHLLKHSGSTMMASMLLVLVVVISGSAIAILMTEAGHPDSNIETAEDAIWWALVTISTVGYGDHYPVTTAGRIISSVVIFAGVTLFAGVSGLVASAVLSPKTEEQQEAVEQAVENEEQEVNQQLGALRAEIASLREEIHTLRDVLGQHHP